MFKTIFSKMVTIFIAILLVSISITGIILYLFLSNFVLSEKIKVLDQSGDNINYVLSQYINNEELRVNRSNFRELLNSISNYSNSIIWIIDKEGYIVIDRDGVALVSNSGILSKSAMNEILERFENPSRNPRLPDKRQYEKVVSGKEPYIQEMGNLYGLFKNTGVTWLTIQKPFIYENEVRGAVFLSTPIPEVNRLRTNIFQFFIFSVAISIIISILLVYIFSLRITKPLKKINQAAKVIADGEFIERLDIESKDEIGELAVSFNNMAFALQNLEEMRRGFIANVSHELRTPMTSMRGFIDGILDGTIPPEKQREYLSIVRDETNRLNRLVNDLLDLAKMEAGELTLHFIQFDMNELVRRCIIKLESIIVKKGIEIEARFEEEEMQVCADIDAIERVLLNLIHNAIKFTPENGNIMIRTYPIKDKVAVTIKDNGTGIGQDEMDLIWERFYKSDKSRSKGGTGLGLSIVKNIINEHHQEITVESTVGEGTSFTFTLDKARES